MDNDAPDRAALIDIAATTLLHRSSRVLRLLAASGTRELSRTEAGLLKTLLDGPRRITELAETEALAQPSITKVVDRLEACGLVTRERSTEDGRVVFVAISAEGRAKIETFRLQVQSMMRETVANLSDHELAILAAAGDVLERVIANLQEQRSTW